jgi:hypothetical protein
MACDGNVDLMLQFQLEKEDNGTKHYRKMKWRYRTRLDSIGRKRDTTQWRGDISRRRDDTGGGKEEDDTNWTDMNLTVLKNKKGSTWLIQLL